MVRVDSSTGISRRPTVLHTDDRPVDLGNTLRNRKEGNRSKHLFDFITKITIKRLLLLESYELYNSHEGFLCHILKIMAPIAVTLQGETSANATVGAMGKTTSGKKLKIRAYPKFQSLEEERLYRKQHLAAAYRIFAERGFDEGVAGHISVRDPILTDHFCENDFRTTQV